MFRPCSLLRNASLPVLNFAMLVILNLLKHYNCIFFSFSICRKYEEMDPPGVDEFCSITDHTYDKTEVNMQCCFFLLLFVGSFLNLVFMVIGDI